MNFFKKKTVSYKGYSVPEDESYRISLTNTVLTMLLLIVSGLGLSAAFPPLNWEVLAFAAVAYLIKTAMKIVVSWKLFMYGYLWSLTWSFCAYFWLREINVFVPFGIAAVKGLWGGVYAVLVSFAWQWSFRSEKVLMSDFKIREKCSLKWYKGLFFAIFCSALFIALEYIRIGMFPWNFIGVTQYKMLYLIQIVKYTGIYGVSFMVLGVNAVLALAIWTIENKMRSKDVEWQGVIAPALFFAILISAVCCWGYFECRKVEKDYLNGRKVRFGVVQGDISQRRISSAEMAKEALDVYIRLSYELASEKPDIIVWPETAVPYPYFGGNYVSGLYRSYVWQFVRSKKIPLLTGTLDFVRVGRNDYDMTNSALLINSQGRVGAKYAKINRVPFGEFIPFSKYLPESWIEKIGMGRDLRAGTNAAPLPILPGVRAGMAICYESIFASLARDEANLGANMLLAINNDAWYPESSEPEQHVANALFRCVETGLPALRSGNNGASVWILPSGRIGWQMDEKLLDRSRKIGIADGLVQERPVKTFYTRYGDVFLLLLFVVTAGVLLYGFYQYFSVLHTLRRENQEE
ncbi:MAG: apolipoprotein N-acyltransferase [Lentisphaeria bacterium]|nr:apolipoprotein N-acyltransferase [Lentisphaeria bacterium]